MGVRRGMRVLGRIGIIGGGCEWEERAWAGDLSALVGSIGGVA